MSYVHHKFFFLFWFQPKTYLSSSVAINFHIRLGIHLKNTR